MVVRVRVIECSFCGSTYCFPQYDIKENDKVLHRCEDCYNFHIKLQEIRIRRLEKRVKRREKQVKQLEKKEKPLLRREKVNIDIIKKYVSENPDISKVDDILALTKANDPFYIQPSNIIKAEWFAMIWNTEKAISDWEDGKIHPRGLHYQILGKGYEITVSGNTIEYENTTQCWHYLEKGAKYARLLGLVPYEMINDEQNPDPSNVPNFWDHDALQIIDVEILSDYYGFRIPYLHYDNIDSFIRNRIDKTMKELFNGVDYYSKTAQPNYFEIWAEKSGVIPRSVAQEFDATIRPAGGGEFSVDMCFQAVNKAKQSNKDLHIFVLADFDPKGLDMPKSVSRKVEYIAQQLEVNAFVHHVALTKEQCIKYNLPTVPAKRESQTSKGYITHTEMFKKYAGQDPTEINSFQAREPEAYKNAIREAIEPYFDRELEKKYDQELDRLKKSVRQKLEAKFEELKPRLIELREILNERFAAFKEIVEPIANEQLQELEIDKPIEEYEQLIDFDVSEVIEGEEFEFPDIEVNEPEDPLLDTRRSYLEQMDKYKEFDMRNREDE